MARAFGLDPLLFAENPLAISTLTVLSCSCPFPILPTLIMAGGGDVGDCGGSASAGSESSVAGGGTVGGGTTVPWSHVRDSRYFMEEVWRRGEPSVRPDSGRIVLARTAGMATLEERYRGRALFARVEGDMRVTAAALLAAMEVDCGVQQAAVKVEVTSPPTITLSRSSTKKTAMLWPCLTCVPAARGFVSVVGVVVLVAHRGNSSTRPL